MNVHPILGFPAKQAAIKLNAIKEPKTNFFHIENLMSQLRASVIDV